MTVRAYIAHAVPAENLPVNTKRAMMQLERKNVTSVTVREPLDLLVIGYEGGKKECFKCKECEIEILGGEPTDGLTDGLQLPF